MTQHQNPRKNSPKPDSFKSTVPCPHQKSDFGSARLRDKTAIVIPVMPTYSLILGYLGEPMRLIVPPHQDLVVGYLAEHKVS